tara:strand:+ start:470 stop:874 length:405 start_codon:yes stop_codon:yes gene_type:complete
MAISVLVGELNQAQAVAVGIETHGFGVHGYAIAEIHARGQVAAMQFKGIETGLFEFRFRGASGHGPRLAFCLLFMLHPVPGGTYQKAGIRERNGAQEKTRTSTALRPLTPEASASTNSATWAAQAVSVDIAATP